MRDSSVADRFWRGVKYVLQLALTLIIVLTIITVGEIVPPMRALDTYIREHRSLEQILLILTIALTVAGTLLLALAQFLPAPHLPETMSREEFERLSPPMKYEEAGWSGTGKLGWRVGGGFSGEASFSSVKRAWRLRSWRYHRGWRLIFAMMLGAILLFFGLFGLFIVLGSAGVKFLMMLVLVYAVARTVWEFYRV